MPAHRIESLLSCRLFQSPQRAGDRLYFLSNLSGHLSLYAMDLGGSVPEPLLPPDLALHNPHLIDGYPFWVFPSLGRILVMVDNNGDEKYRPYVIPLDGGYPEPVFADGLADQRVHLVHCSPETGTVYFNTEAQGEPLQRAFRANLSTRELRELGRSTWGTYVAGASEDNTQVALVDAYTVGDHVLYMWRESDPERRLLYGVPLEQRTPGQQVPLNSIHSCWFTQGGGLLLVTSLFSDAYGLGYVRLDDPASVQPVEVEGTSHEGAGELNGHRLDGTRSRLFYNIDGCSWAYEGEFDEDALRIRLNRVVCGRSPLANGVLDSFRFDRSSASFAVSYSTATSPTQLYTIDGSEVCQHTRERILGIPTEDLSPGEDASFISHDGLRISARLYFPSPALGYTGPRPLVYYIHGGPQSQERPDFAWFSMPLIQFLTLRGFAVFVPNVRGSTGYGLEYTKHVDRDWGGKDRLDHVHAMTEVLRRDPRIDVGRAGVIGRSYGGYMTLTLASRHPDLWRGAVDMFGVYNLFTFLERIPETWKPYFSLSLGDPERDRNLLI
ncbi:MAG: S9 family peptidase, partial [bacterium]